jgi:hypothetical protein
MGFPAEECDRRLSEVTDTGHVFVSYRSIERSFAIRLTGALLTDGVSVWVDRLPEGIKPGDEWPKTIEQAIDTCHAFVAVVSPEYVKSKVCCQEWRRASRLGKPIFPVLMRELTDQEDWPLELEGLQYVDFQAWRSGEEFAAAVGCLLDRLKTGARPVVGQRPDPEQRYLIGLISELEAQAYLSLAAELRSLEPDDELARDKDLIAEWGLGAEFTLFERRASGKKRTVAERRIGDPVELLGSPRRFVLLGEPGAGKSTALRRLALDAARRRLSDPRDSRLPLLLNLGTWQKETDPLRFVQIGWPFKTPLEAALEADEVALFLDGLNEMGGYTRSNAGKLKRWLDTSGIPSQLVVTCRLHDYQELDLGLDRVEIRPLDPGRIRKFSRLYLKEKVASFLKNILPAHGRANNSRDLALLARNPYLCQCLMVLFVNAPDGELPHNVGTLLRDLVKVLWERELTRETRGWVPYHEAEERFSELAYQMIDEGASVAASRQTLRAAIGEDLLHAGLSASILSERGHSIQFSHQLMQEYFAAVRTLKGAPITGLARREKWREVLGTAVGLVSDPDDFVGEVLAGSVVTAAHCVALWPDLREDTVDRVVSQIVAELDPLVRTSLEASFARYMETATFSDWGSREMANDALRNAVDRRDQLKSALREMGNMAIERLGASRVRDYLRHSPSG